MVHRRGGTNRVNTLNPISIHHLNQNLEAAWVVLPGTAGLTTSVSSVRSYPDLKRRFPGWPGITGTSRGWNADPNGFLGLHYNGGGAGAVVNVEILDTATALNYSTSFSVGCWFRQDAVGSGTIGLSGLVTKYQTASAWGLRLENQTCELYGDARVMGGTTTLGRWHCLIGTVDGSGNGVLYLDGTSVATGSPSPPSNTTDNVRLGLDYVSDATFRCLNGIIAGGWVWSRTLSIADAVAWTDQCRRGFPNVLNRYGGFRTYAEPAAAAGGGITQAKLVGHQARLAGAGGLAG